MRLRRRPNGGHCCTTHSNGRDRPLAHARPDLLHYRFDVPHLGQWLVRIEDGADGLDELGDLRSRKGAPAREGFLLVFGLEEGDQRLVVPKVRDVDRIDAAVLASVGHRGDRLVEIEVEQSRHTQRTERVGDPACGIVLAALREPSPIGLDEPAHPLVDNPGIEVGRHRHHASADLSTTRRPARGAPRAHPTFATTSSSASPYRSSLVGPIPCACASSSRLCGRSKAISRSVRSLATT